MAHTETRSLSIYDGRDLIGRIAEHAGELGVDAHDADGKALGRFHDQREAILAIEINHKRVQAPRSATAA